jgi:hypothetical protein
MAGLARGEDKPLPGPVTLHVKNAKLQDVISELAKQTSLQFTVQFENPDTPLITLDSDNEPLWNVLDKVCSQIHCSFDMSYGNPPPIMINFYALPDLQIISGPLVGRFQQIDRTTRLTASPGNGDSCNISVNVMWDPRLDVLYVQPTSTPTVAEDENGLSLVPAPPSGGRQFFGEYRPKSEMGGSACMTNFTIPIAAPQNAGRKVAHLQGKIQFYVTGTTDHADIENLKAPAKNGTNVQLGDLGAINVRQGGISDQLVPLTFTMNKRAGDSENDWTRKRMLLQGAHCKVYAADGKIWGESQGLNGWSWSDRQMTIYVNISRTDGGTEPPAKLSIEAAVSAQEVDLPYDFKDIPLP